MQASPRARRGPIDLGAGYISYLHLDQTGLLSSDVRDGSYSGAGSMVRVGVSILFLYHLKFKSSDLILGGSCSRGPIRATRR